MTDPRIEKLLGALREIEKHGTVAEKSDFEDHYTPHDCARKMTKISRETIAQIEVEIAGEQRMSGCPECGSAEVDAMTPRTVYACESSDYDQQPGTFKQSEKCKKKLIIRAAKRLIEALNLPEGGGVAWDDVTRWWWTVAKPTFSHNEWMFNGDFDTLPDTALPPWPGDRKNSWITRDTPEVE